MPRTICGVALGLGLGLAVGCGSNPEPTLPKVAIESGPAAPAQTPDAVPAPSNSASVAPAAKADAPKLPLPAWEMDPTKHVIPDAPVTGTLAGATFTPVVVMDGPVLKLRAFKTGSPAPEREIAITLPQSIDGGTFKVQPDEPNSPALPRIFAVFPPAAADRPGGSLYPGSHASYALTLELGKRKDGKVTGRIYLSLYDESKTALAGTFTAPYTRPQTERPGPDDAPSVSGDVSVTGAKPDAQVRVGFCAFPSGSNFFQCEMQLPFDPSPAELAPSTWDEKNKNSVLVAGDGKGRPFRYEHVKIAPGRYLLSAAVVGGPVMWKWVDVPAGGTLTENFALDANRAGGVEISTHLDLKGKVYIAPAEEAGKPALAEELFEAVAIHLVRQEVELVAGKATVKNLAPGKYEVRVGAERRTVEVVADKIAELDMTPPKK